MRKIHYRYDQMTEGAPKYIRDDWIKNGFSGTYCGYVRKNTTYNEDEVTCFYCKNKLKQQKEAWDNL